MRRRRGMGSTGFHVSIQLANAFECFPAALATGRKKLPNATNISGIESARRRDLGGLREARERDVSAENGEDLIEARARGTTRERDARGLRDVLDLEARRREVLVRLLLELRFGPLAGLGERVAERGEALGGVPDEELRGRLLIHLRLGAEEVVEHV